MPTPDNKPYPKDDALVDHEVTHSEFSYLLQYEDHPWPLGYLTMEECLLEFYRHWKNDQKLRISMMCHFN